MKCVVFTLGCKVNQSESDSLLKEFFDCGWEVSDSLEKADLYILNTCAVTGEAEKKSRQAVARIRKLNASAKIIVTGCAAQKSPASFLSNPAVFSVFGTFGKDKIPCRLDEKGACIQPEPDKFEELSFIRTFKTRAYVKVQDGCDNFCSYCIVPYLRGRSRSRKPVKIKEEILSLNPLETVLNGINLSSYRYGETGLTQLLSYLKDVRTRLRLGSLEPNVIDVGFLEACGNLYNFAPHFHLSLQSGSDEVLKKMNRRYTASEFLSKVNLIREFFPDAGITTDVIVGFPTETDSDFEKTLELVRKARFSDAHCFCYSSRSGTAASKMKDLPSELKKERFRMLEKVCAGLKDAFIAKNFGATLDFSGEDFSDGFTRGYTGNYIRGYLEGDYRGKTVTATGAGGYNDGIMLKLKEN